MKERFQGHFPPARHDESRQETPQSGPEEQQQSEAVRERTSISVHIVYEAILAEGEMELRRSSSALAFSGLAAGLSMGFSFLMQGFLLSRLPVAPWAQLISKLGYAMGFLIVILGRQQLFTENTLTPIIPLLKHKQIAILWDTLRLWGAVFLANWVGTMVFAWVISHTEVVGSEVRAALLEIGREAGGHTFVTTLLKGIFAGWLIALLVWLLPFAESGRVAVIVLMTYTLALGSFTHVVAGSVDVFYLVMVGDKSWGQYLGGFMVPTLLGNIVGGVSLVAALNHAQVVSGPEAQ